MPTRSFPVRSFEQEGNYRRHPVLRCPGPSLLALWKAALLLWWSPGQGACPPRVRSYQALQPYHLKPLSKWFDFLIIILEIYSHLYFLGNLVIWIIWQEKILIETVGFFWNWLQKLHIIPSTHSLSLKIKLRPLKMALGSANFPKCRLLGFPFLPVRWWVEKDTTSLYPHCPQ